jgi:hypothetical protein
VRVELNISPKPRNYLLELFLEDSPESESARLKIFVKRMTRSSQHEDWRILFLGEYIQQTTGSLNSDIETSFNLIPTIEALSDIDYDFIALYIGSDSCPSCRSFSQTILQSLSHLERKRCKVIFVSDDKEESCYATSIRKVSSLDFMCYSPSKTQVLRGYYNIATIPAFLIFRNTNFSGSLPELISNARYHLTMDPKCVNFPWPDTNSSLFSVMDRLIIGGQYGKWWDYGHRIHPKFVNEPYMDDHAVRARAGILNIITWIALMKVLYGSDEMTFANFLFPIIFWDFLSSMIWGLTPFAPFGVIGTLIAIHMQPTPKWTPARPKRFAWAIGLIFSATCFSGFTFRHELGHIFLPLMLTTVLTCNIFTWLECSTGFCVGCWMYNNILVPTMKWNPCVECQ